MYADETHLHCSHNTLLEWTDCSTEDVKAPMNKGQPLIIIYAGEVYQIKMLNPVLKIIMSLIIYFQYGIYSSRYS